MDIRGTIELDGTITGELTSQKSLSGELSSTNKISGGLSPGSTVVRSYNKLTDKPSIENVTLEGDKTFRQLGLDTLSVQEIEQILYFG